MEIDMQRLEVDMEAHLESTLTQLHAGELLRIEDGAGQSVAVFDGLVWVTQDGDPRDAFVTKGQTIMLDRPGLALVEALTNTRLIVLEGLASEEAANESAFN
jgi:hypothetical protein